MPSWTLMVVLLSIPFPSLITFSFATRFSLNSAHLGIACQGIHVTTTVIIIVSLSPALLILTSRSIDYTPRR